MIVLSGTVLGVSRSGVWGATVRAACGGSCCSAWNASPGVPPSSPFGVAGRQVEEVELAGSRDQALESPVFEKLDEPPDAVSVDGPRAPCVVESLQCLLGGLVGVEAGRRMKPRIGGVVRVREVFARGVEPSSGGTCGVVHVGPASVDIPLASTG